MLPRKKLLVITTKPQTLNFILKGQPKALSSAFNVVVVTSPDDGFELIAQRENVEVFPVPMERGINIFKDLVSLFKMIRIINKVKPDIVQTYTPKAGLVGIMASFFCRVPVRVHTFTGLIFPYRTGLLQKLLVVIDKLICRLATNIVPESEGVKALLKEYSITDKELTLIGKGNIAGVDCTHFSAEHFAVEKANVFTFVYVGRIHCDKGIKELIEAFSGIREDARLVLIGDFDDEGPLDHATLSAIKNNEKILLAGFKGDIRSDVLKAHVLVLPSYREGFPNVILQAGALGLPSIVTDIPGSNELIVDGVNGWIVPVKSIIPLRDAMVRAINSPPESLSAMGATARNIVLKNFEVNQHHVRLIKFYSEL